MPPDLLRVGSRVGHKPDPPDPWTPLADTITESTASATVVTTREILVEALALPLRPISAE